MYRRYKKMSKIAKKGVDVGRVCDKRLWTERMGDRKMFYCYFTGTGNGEWVEAANMNSAKWIFALKNNLKSISYISASKKKS